MLHHVDDLVMEYLLYRGMSDTINNFNREKKDDKLKCLSSESIANGLLELIHSGELTAFVETWNFMHDKCFALSSANLETSVKLKCACFKLMLVNAVRKSDTECIRKVLQHLDGNTAWKDWYALPYCEFPKSDPRFSLFFEKTWEEAFCLSLHNFLAQVFRERQAPKLLLFPLYQKKQDSMEAQLRSSEFECARLREEIERLKTMLLNRTATKLENTNLVEPALDIPLQPQQIESKPQLTDTHPLIHIASGSHTARINRCRMSLDGRVLASASHDGTVRLWDLAQANEGSTEDLDCKQLVFAPNNVLSLSWMDGDDFRLLALGHASNSVLMWNSDRNELAGEIPTVGDSVSAPNVIDIQYCRRSHLLAAVNLGRQAQPISTPRNPIPGCKQAAAYFDTTKRIHCMLRLWNMNTLQCTNTLHTGYECSINATVFNHNGSLLITGASDGEVRVFDVTKGTSIMQWSTQHPITRLCLSADETSVACLADDGRVTIWSLHRINQAVATFPVHVSDTVHHVKHDPFIAVGDITAHQEHRHEYLTCYPHLGGTAIYKLDSSNIGRVAWQTSHRDTISSLDWTTGGSKVRLCTGSHDHTVRYYHLASTI